MAAGRPPRQVTHHVATTTTTPHHTTPYHTMSLPYAADAETSLSPSELGVLRSQYESELAQGHVTTQTKFNYAWGLVKSKNRDDMSHGVGLLTEIYRSDPPRRRECLYYLSLGHYKMGNYDEARRFNGQFKSTPPPLTLYPSRPLTPTLPSISSIIPSALNTVALLIEREPHNLQAQSLSQLIEKGVARGRQSYSPCTSHQTSPAHTHTLIFVIFPQRATLAWPSSAVPLPSQVSPLLASCEEAGDRP